MLGFDEPPPPRSFRVSPYNLCGTGLVKGSVPLEVRTYRSCQSWFMKQPTHWLGRTPSRLIRTYRRWRDEGLRQQTDLSALYWIRAPEELSNLSRPSLPNYQGSKTTYSLNSRLCGPRSIAQYVAQLTLNHSGKSDTVSRCSSQHRSCQVYVSLEHVDRGLSPTPGGLHDRDVMCTV